VVSPLSLGDDWATGAAAPRQVHRCSWGPSPATSTPRYVRPLVFPSRCAKSSAQTLTYYLCSDLIWSQLHMHVLCLLNSILLQNYRLYMLTPMSFAGSAPAASMAAERWRGYRLWRASMRFHMRRNTCWRRLTLALLVWSNGTPLFCNCCKWLLKYMVSRFVFNLHNIDILAVTILGLLVMITLFVHELQFYLTTYTVHQVWLATAYIFLFDCYMQLFQCNIQRLLFCPFKYLLVFFPWGTVKVWICL
jgi:hypothetical protein